MASDDYEVNSPESEQELPASAASAGAAIYDIPSEDAEKIERRAQAKKAEQEIHLKDNAFSLLCACLVGGAVLYIIDTIVLWNDKKECKRKVSNCTKNAEKRCKRSRFAEM